MYIILYIENGQEINILLFIGNLICYNDHRTWDIFLKKAYVDKYLKMAKWETGEWKYVLIIGDFPPQPSHKVVELSDGSGICTIPKSIIYDYKSGYDGKMWRK